MTQAAGPVSSVVIAVPTPIVAPHCAQATMAWAKIMPVVFGVMMIGIGFGASKIGLRSPFPQSGGRCKLAARSWPAIVHPSYIITPKLGWNPGVAKVIWLPIWLPKDKNGLASKR